MVTEATIGNQNRQEFLKIRNSYLTSATPIQSPEHLKGRQRSLQVLEHNQPTRRTPLPLPTHQRENSGVERLARRDSRAGPRSHPAGRPRCGRGGEVVRGGRARRCALCKPSRRARSCHWRATRPMLLPPGVKQRAGIAGAIATSPARMGSTLTPVRACPHRAHA